MTKPNSFTIGRLAGRAIAIIRTKHGLTQTELARMIGATQSMVNRYEVSSDVSVARVYSIADALKIDPLVIFTMVNDLVKLTDAELQQTIGLTKKPGGYRGYVLRQARRDASRTFSEVAVIAYHEKEGGHKIQATADYFKTTRMVISKIIKDHREATRLLSLLPDC